MLNSLTGNTTPTTYTLRPRNGASAWIDTDKNGKVDDHDSFMALQTTKGTELVDMNDLRQTLKAVNADKQPVDDQVVIEQLKKQFDDQSLVGFDIIGGNLNFDNLSTYRHKQSFQLQGDEISYTLQFDPNAPLRQYDPATAEEGVAVLVKNEDGVLLWELPEVAEKPLPEGAVAEITQVDRGGVLLWLWPGDVPEPGDKVNGTLEEIQQNMGV